MARAQDYRAGSSRQTPHDRDNILDSVCAGGASLLQSRRRLLLFLPDPGRFGAVVRRLLLEPLVLQRLLGRDPLRRIIHEDALQQVQELAVKLRRRGYYFLLGQSLFRNARHDLREAFSPP